MKRLALTTLLLLLASSAPAKIGKPGSLSVFNFNRYFFVDYEQYSKGNPYTTADTARLSIRNPRKPLPLYFTGRNDGGLLTMRFAKGQDFSGFAEDPDLAALMQLVKTKGTIRIALTRRIAPRVNLDKTTASDWARAETPPKLAIRIDELTTWLPPAARTAQRDVAPKVPAPPGGPGGKPWQAKFKGALLVDDKETPLAGRSRILFEQARKKGGVSRMFPMGSSQLVQSTTSPLASRVRFMRGQWQRKGGTRPCSSTPFM